MRVLVVSERYWPDGSGGELATHLIVGLLRRSFEVTVVTGSRSPEKHDGVEYIYEPLLSRWEKPVLWLNTFKLLRCNRFRELVRRSDVVYVPRFAFPVIPFAKKMGKRIVVHLHDYIPISYTATILAPFEEHRNRITQDDIMLECMKGFKYCGAATTLWWLPKLARHWITQADKIICVSKRQAEIVAELMPELRNKIEVVYNPLPPEILNKKFEKKPSETPTILYIGGDSYVKGFHILLQAIKRIDKEGVKMRFILANKYSLSALASINVLKRKLKNITINVVGRISHERLIDLHREVWALLFPSILEETFGYAVVESMALGTIPIASRVGGVAEIVSGTLAERFQFNPNSLNDLVRVISYLCAFSIQDITMFGSELRLQVLHKFNFFKGSGNALLLVFSMY